MIDLENIALVDRLRNHNDERLYREADLLMSEAADRIAELESRCTVLNANLEAAQESYAQLEVVSNSYLQDVDDLERTLRTVERWANHHAQHPNISAENALGVIQHHPAIRAITKGYADGVVPDTFNPYARIAVLEAQLSSAEFWKGVYPKGWTVERVKNEMTDFHTLLDGIPSLYMHVTGGRVSKELTDKSVIKSLHDEHVTNLVEEAVAEWREEFERQLAELRTWQPIETAPWDKEVVIKGPSGYTTHPEFLINAYRVKGWHQGDWNDATGNPLSDYGWKPTHWKEWEHA